MRLEGKQGIVEQVAADISHDEFAAFVEYKGLTVADMAKLRVELKRSDSKLTVLKLTLLKKALEKSGSDVDFTTLKNRQLALVLSRENSVEPSKALYDFSRINNKLIILGGIVEGVSVGPEQIMRLAKLPSREQLIAHALRSMKAPVNNFVYVLKANLSNLVWVLKGIEKLKN